MKKILTTLAVGAMLATAASADMGRVEMGVGAWQQTPSGVISYTDALGIEATDTSKEVEETSAYVWMLIKHPIPILPNIRLEYVNVDSTGTAEGKFEDFDVPTTSTTALSMTQYDIIPYYNILDNTGWVTLDLGLDIKVIEVDYQANGVIDNNTLLPINYTESETIAIPLVYVRARVEIPGTNIGLETDGKYITYDDSTVYDVRVKVDYTLDFIPVIQPAIEVGYRVQKIDLSDDGDTAGTTAKFDMEYSGVYAGLMVRF